MKEFVQNLATQFAGLDTTISMTNDYVRLVTNVIQLSQREQAKSVS